RERQCEQPYGDRDAAVLDRNDLMVLAPNVLCDERVRIVYVMITVSDCNICHLRASSPIASPCSRRRLLSSMSSSTKSLPVSNVSLKGVDVSDEVVHRLLVAQAVGHHPHLCAIEVLNVSAPDIL